MENLKENIIMEKPRGLIINGKEEKVYKQKHALYVLKQA